jgi:hypothetical protein
VKGHIVQERNFLLGGKRVCCRGSWHASLGEGLACTPRRNSSTFLSVRTAATVRPYTVKVGRTTRKRRHRNRGATSVPVGMISKGFSAEKIVQLCTVQNNIILAHFPRQF